MTSFSDEIRIIPRTAWVIGLLAYGCLSSLLMFVAMPQDHKLSHWPLVGQIAFSFGIPLTLLVYVLLIGYVNADARRRGMRYVMWTLLAIFLPNSVGVILYFVLRDPMPLRCGKCGGRGKSSACLARGRAKVPGVLPFNAALVASAWAIGGYPSHMGYELLVSKERFGEHGR